MNTHKTTKREKENKEGKLGEENVTCFPSAVEGGGRKNGKITAPLNLHVAREVRKLSTTPPVSFSQINVSCWGKTANVS